MIKIRQIEYSKLEQLKILVAELPILSVPEKGNGGKVLQMDFLNSWGKTLKKSRIFFGLVWRVELLGDRNTQRS